MKKQVEKLITFALAAVRDKLLVPGKPSQVYEEYDGYAASFGASVVTAGLLPTVSFYTNVHKKDPVKPRRYKMLMALADILRSNGRTAIGTGDTALLDFLEAGQNRTDKTLKAEIIAASIALKLALRNFQHIKSNSES